MIRTMYQFGLHLQDVEDMAPYFEPAAEPYPSKTEDNIVLVAEVYSRKFSRLTIETYKTALVPKYLFRELASANSTSLVPTLHLYRDDEKVNPKTGKVKLEEACEKFLNKLKRCLDSSPGLYDQLFDSTEFLQSLTAGFVNFVQANLPQKKNYLFTIKIDDKWLGEIPTIRDYFESRSYDKYFQDGKGEPYTGLNKTCAVTYRQNVPEVWGRVDTLGFTVNDISFSRNGFDARDSYKMFPVSPEAVKILEGTMRALDNKMSFRFAGLKFLVLPHFVALPKDQVRQKNLVRRFANSITDTPGFDPLLQAIFNTEAIFNTIINDPELGNNSVYYDIFFYEEKQAQFVIKLHVSDVLPSRFRIIREVKRAITEFYQPITQKRFKKGREDSIKYFTPNFLYIKDYFSIKREKETLIEPFFFKIVEAVFYKNKIDEQQVLKAFMNKIVSAYKNVANNPYAFQDYVKQSFCIYQLFQTLQLFGDMEQEGLKKELAFTAIEFVDQHPRFFDHHLKKAAFYLGCATEKLLNHQDQKYDNKPFMKNLLNLYVDYKGMGEIFHKLRKKADEYAKDIKPTFYYPAFNKMLAEAGEQLAQGNSDNITKTEISYAFSLGLIMEKEFRGRQTSGKAKKAAEKNEE